MKFSLGATIPVTQYGNLQPTIEVEAESYEEAEKIALRQIQKLWNKVCEPGRELSIREDRPSNTNRYICFVGGEIDYDPIAHIYSWKGEKYLSASEYARQFIEPFDSYAMAERVSLKCGANPIQIEDCWKLNSEISRDFGSVLHKAMELYGKYKKLAVLTKKDYHINKHPIIKKAVEEFYGMWPDASFEHEVMVVDHAAKRAGRIDLLQITGEKTCLVQDFKTNHDLGKSLASYWEQLKFYGGIMEAAGWEVEGYDIHHYNGEWKLIHLEKNTHKNDSRI